MEKNLYHELLENLFDAVYYVDTEKRITYWNRAAERITGFSRDEVTGSKCSDNILRHIDYYGKELCVDGCPLSATLEDGQVRTVDAFLHHREGHRVPVSIRISPIRDDTGKITGAVEIFSDNSSRDSILKEIESLRHEIYTDPLTGIGNRRYGDMVLKTRMFEFETQKINFGIIFIDIDNFKKINDRYGHDTGDAVLKMVSKTTANVLRKLDVLCRWGGEEFIAVIPNIDSEYLARLSERIRSFVERSFIIRDDEKLIVTVSIGAASVKENDSVDSLVKRADKLMYKSKSCGRNMVSCED